MGALTPQAVVDWAASRWQSEVANRPLQNVHRRSLDDTWRQVIRHFGGDDIALCGPVHDELACRKVAAASWPAQNIVPAVNDVGGGP